MIDRGLLETIYSEEEMTRLCFAMGELHALGVFKHQMQENAMRIATGFTDREPEAFAIEIKQVQQTNRHLLALHELAGDLKKDERNA